MSFLDEFENMASWIVVLLLAVFFFWAFNKAVFEPLLGLIVSLVGSELLAVDMIKKALTYAGLRKLAENLSWLGEVEALEGLPPLVHDGYQHAHRHQYDPGGQQLAAHQANYQAEQGLEHGLVEGPEEEHGEQEQGYPGGHVPELVEEAHISSLLHSAGTATINEANIDAVARRTR